MTSKIGPAETGEKRNKEFHIRVTESEFRLIKDMAKDLNFTVSRLMLDALLAYSAVCEDREPDVIFVSDKGLNSLHAELRRVGNNLNQTTKALNYLVRTLGPIQKALPEKKFDVDEAFQAIGESTDALIEISQCYKDIQSNVDLIKAKSIYVKSHRSPSKTKED